MAEIRQTWTVEAPPGGWLEPWPLVVELARVFPSDCWTLIGGMMVTIHMARAQLPVTISTNDVDLLLHIETGATTFAKARRAVESLGYQPILPTRKGSPMHRFVRGGDQIDVMVADRLAPKWQQRFRGMSIFGVAGGTSALRKTVNVRILDVDGASVRLSVPDVLGALVLKGAAFRSDTRDRERHLNDGAALACALESPAEDATRMIGSDRKRVGYLAEALQDPNHTSWLGVPTEIRMNGWASLRVLMQNLEAPKLKRELGN